MNTTNEKYALFFWHQPVRQAAQSRFAELQALLRGEQHEEFAVEPRQPPLQKQLVFLKMMDTAAELTAQIAKSPTLDYVVMRGPLQNVKSSTSVYVGGKNLLKEEIWPAQNKD
jgi:hypothetical protein